MQILQHSQIAMTIEVYSEVPTVKTKSALNRLGGQQDSQRLLYEGWKGPIRCSKSAF
jgi:hypothetical protein